MKIKLQDYSLISTTWLDDAILISEAKIETLNKKNNYYYAVVNELRLLKDIKQLLIPIDKVKEELFKDEPYLYHEDFLETEIEIK